MKIRLGILSLLIGYVNSLKFYPFSHSFSSNNPICHNGDLLDKSIRGGCNTIQNNHNLKYSLMGLDTDIEHIKSAILKIVSKFISAGVDRHSQSLAVFYVLGALTMVSKPAADNLPWLYESFSNLQLQ